MDSDTVKEIRDELKVIRESQLKTEADLFYHIKRTDSLEKLLQVHESKMERQVNEVGSKVAKIEVPYKVSLFILSTLGLVAIIMQILTFTK
jgi:hypothetical protein